MVKTMTEEGKNYKILSPLEQSTRHPWWRYASNSMLQIVASLNGSVQGIYLVFFYVQVLGLEYRYVFWTLTLFAIYDALNDPIIGFLTDRNFKWTKKLGRRFPWVVIGIGPWCIAVWLIFSAPMAEGGPWRTILWLLMSLFVFDTFGTLVGTNVGMTRPDMFRTEKERRIFTGVWTYIDMTAQAMGMLLPPMLLAQNPTRADYGSMALVMAIICLGGALLMLPGSKEDKIVIDRYFTDEEKARPKPKFFKGIWQAFKQRSFITAFIIMMVFNIAVSMLMTMGPYVSTFLFKSNIDELFIYIVFFSGTIVGVPFWMYYLKKSNNTKMVIVYGGLALGSCFCLLTIPWGVIGIFVVFFITGASMGSLWAYLWTVLLFHVVDEYTVRNRINSKGIVLGFFAFLTRLVTSLDEGIITLVQNFTRFPAGITDYTMLELHARIYHLDMNMLIGGIRYMIGVIPGVLLILGTIIFWIFYPLTAKKVTENKLKLAELKL
jgi:GPH family glycoside/pentoside/hexuronide:cation symporter